LWRAGRKTAFVAAAALRGRAFEPAIDVAGREIDAVVAAREREAGHEMVECPLLRLGARTQKPGRGHPEAEQDRNHPQQSFHQFTAYELRFFLAMVFARALTRCPELAISAQPRRLPDRASAVA